MGTFYSRCVGFLESTGKYVLEIDNDDLFSESDVFETLYEQTEEESFDIISFVVFAVYYSSQFEDDTLTFIPNKTNNIVLQPELGIYPYKESHPLHGNQAVIWGRLIKGSVIKEAVNMIGKERFSNYIVWSEDLSLYFVVTNVANSYKWIEKYGIIHFVYQKPISKNEAVKRKMTGDIYSLDIIFDFSKKKYKISAIYRLLEMKKMHYFDLSNDSIRAYMKSVVKKIMNSNDIEENDKNLVKDAYKGIDIF